MTTTPHHTPGPWRVGASGNVFTGDSMATIANIERNNDRRIIGRGEANARLIAAAPELLSACYTALDVLNDFMREHEEYADSSVNEDAKQVRAAIAKAEGRT